MNNYRSHITDFLRGVIMGTAEIIPGVSASTLALIMGIYDRLINFMDQTVQMLKLYIISLWNPAKREQASQILANLEWRWGLRLFFGMGISVAILANILTYAIENHPRYVLAVFFGLILASVQVPWSQVKNKSHKNIMLVIVSAVCMFLLMGVKPAVASTQPHLLFLFLGGCVAISGMVLPGVSGSFILLVIGLYDYVISIVKNLTRFTFQIADLIDLAVFGVGLIFGFSIFVKFLKIALTRYRDALMAVITGILIGSLRAIWPFVEYNPGDKLAGLPVLPIFELPPAEVITIFILIFLSAVSVFALIRLGDKQPSDY